MHGMRSAVPMRLGLVLALAVLPRGLAAQDTVRVLAYNVRHGAGMDDSLDLRRAAAVIVAQRPDVVLLQEIDLRMAGMVSLVPFGEAGKVAPEKLAASAR